MDDKAAQDFPGHAFEHENTCTIIIPFRPNPWDRFLPFTYDALLPSARQIRLVTIFPGDWQAEIDCALHTVSLDDKPVFKALSYRWGDLEQSKTIFCNGKRFGVSQRLWNALRRVRQRDDDLVLWVDAICINQADDTEKSHQVAHMGSVFGNCEEALLFLHESSECIVSESTTPPRSWTAIEGLELLEMFSTDVHFDELQCYEKEEGDRLSIKDQYLGHFESLGCLSSYTWWTRIWTVQEAILPPNATLVWASEHYPLKSLVIALKSFRNHRLSCCASLYWNTLSGFTAIGRLEDIAWPLISIQNLKNCRASLSLGTVRQYCVSHRASNPQDLYIGLLGLTDSWGSDKPLVPDYSLSVQQGFVHAGIKMICYNSKFLKGRRTAHKSLNVPSWLPDWAITTMDHYSAEVEFFISARLFRASGNTIMNPRIRDQILVLKALRIDNVSVVGPFCEKVETLAYTLGQWMAIIARATQNDTSKSVSSMQTLAKTASHELVNQSGPTRRATQDDYDIFSTSVLALTTPREDPVSINSYVCILEMNSGIYWRILFTTENGMIGNGYPEAEPGDEVYVILGSPVPFLLRRRCENVFLEEEDDPVASFEVIGNCYVHGIMDGEALQGNWEERVETIALV